ncbi:autotransporter outer membrane beta-barrel domain-containing protein [Breoghania sp. L-A4]|uniref:DUF7933 domain-containing protein n=1 Tax=Breoghania sp. L-A4 TaxID=2304600 RepID=UPI0020BEA4E9|nr:autotransporter outer membrane beta-barrel domain-containing protein [Breoghania sp. L-A4]
MAPGSTIVTRFTIQNTDSSFAATDISFTDDLDAMLSGATATVLPAAGSICGGGTISGTSLLMFSGGSLASRSSCTFDVTIQVPGGAPDGQVTNTTSATSATINSATVAGTAGVANFTVDSTVPLLTKSFGTNPAAAGGSTTLDYTITNTSAGSAMTGVAFTDPVTQDLPITSADITLGGSGTCGGFVFVQDVMGVPSISMSGGAVAAASSCSFSVTLAIPEAAPAGDYASTSEVISATVGGSTVTGSPASDTLSVTAPDVSVSFTKTFTDDPVVPGGSATLQFELINSTEGVALSDLGFTDDLAMTSGSGPLPGGVTATGLPADGFCGTGSSLVVAGGVLTMTGGQLADAASCTFSVSVQIPAGATPDTYTNTTSAVSGDAGGGVVSDPTAVASDTLEISDLLAVTGTKSFTDDPTPAGGNVTLQYTLTNPNAGDDATAISFTDSMDFGLPGTGLELVGALPTDPCGTGSSLGLSGTTNGVLSLSGGNILATGFCTFSITLTVPAATSPGSYGSVSSAISSTIGGTGGFSSSAASDTLSVLSAASGLVLTKSFTDDPALAGDPVTLRFTLDNTAGTSDVTAISFIDDLDAALSGLAATALPATGFCGAGSAISGTSTLSITGANLLAGASCFFDVTLLVPGGAAAGTHINTTSTVSATANSVVDTIAAATDGLQVSPSNVTITKSFTDDPVLPGRPVTLEFSILNPAAGGALSDIRFSDNLDGALTGLVATGLPASNVCGSGSTLSGTSSIALTGGALAPGGSCTFQVTLQVPASAPAGSYVNTTSDVTEGVATIASAVSDTLVVSSPVPNMTFAKSFTDDPVIAGDTGTLQFTITNPDTVATITAIGFTDDLDAMATGTTVASVAGAGFCGGSAALAGTGTGTLTMTGGSLAPGASCVFTIGFMVPGSTAAGDYANTTSVLSGTANTVAGTAGTASDTLSVLNPVADTTFSASFTEGTVGVGATTPVQFTITNPNTTLSVDAIGFTADLSTIFAGVTSASLPANGFCGAGATMTGGGTLSMSGGSLAANTSCTFTVQVQLPGTIPTGGYTLTTNNLFGSVNGVPTTGPNATAMVTVVAAPTLAVTPATNLSGTGPQGGPFTPPSITYTLENQGTVPLNYTAAADVAFVDVTPPSGTIPASGTTTVTVAFNAAADALAAGAHNGIVTFTNLSNASATTTRTVSLSIQALGTVTLVQRTQAGDGTFTFSSVTAALNVAVTTTDGTGTSGGISLAAGTYMVTQTPPDDGFGLTGASCDDTDSTVDLATRTATIVLATNESVVCTFDSANSRERTVEVINRFLHRRADLILSSEPDSGRRIDRLRNPNGGASGSGAPFEFGMTAPGSVSATFETSVSQIRAAYAAQDNAKAAMIATSGAFANPAITTPEAKWDFWVSAQVTQFNDDTGGSDGDGMFGILYLGGDYRVNSSLLIGAVVQLDYLDQSWNDISASASGTGWMAGPYATVRITDNLFFDSRAAWGMSSNEISPFNTYTDNFDTTRWLVRAGLIGDWRFGDFSFRPSASVAYMQETQDAYVDSLAVTIPSQTVSLGQANFGPSVAYRYTTEDGLTFEPSASLKGIWNFSSDTSGATTTTSAAGVDFRAKAEVGLRVRGVSGVSLQGSASYDGIGVDDYDAVTGRLELSVPFN